MNNLNIIILAAGKSSRLKHVTNYLPKCLVNIGNKTALGEQIDYWKKYNPRKIYVIVHSQYKQLTEGYLIANDYTNVVVLTENNQAGSADAINSMLSTNEHVLGSNIILNWSDIIPQSPVDIESDLPIIFTNGNQCRYMADQSKVFNVDSGGNVIGIYFIPNIKYSPIEKDLDYVEIFKNTNINIRPIDKILDFGDLTKYDDACKNLQISREFNTIKILDNTVVKTAVNSKGILLQNAELNWYSHIQDIDLIPKILNNTNNQFTMTKLDGYPIFEFKGNKYSKIRKWIDGITIIHNIQPPIKISKTTLESDIKKECIDKLNHRCNVIDKMINGFPLVTKINGINLLDHNTISNLLFDKILECNKNTSLYRFIHGDCNGSNTFLVNDTIKFIDPRGYFGTTELYGLPSYDLSKILYACSGYDNFNASTKFSMPSITNGEMLLTIEPWIENFMDLDEFFTKEHYFWLPLIWINLGGYFKNNPVKAVCAYYYGLYLANKVLLKYNIMQINKDGSMV